MPVVPQLVQILTLLSLWLFDHCGCLVTVVVQTLWLSCHCGCVVSVGVYVCSQVWWRSPRPSSSRAPTSSGTPTPTWGTPAPTRWSSPWWAPRASRPTHGCQYHSEAPKNTSRWLPGWVEGCDENSQQGMSHWWPLLGPLSWCPIFKWSHYNSFEDWAPVDSIYVCPIFKWVAENWLHDQVPGYQVHLCLLGNAMVLGMWWNVFKIETNT